MSAGRKPGRPAQAPAEPKVPAGTPAGHEITQRETEFLRQVTAGYTEERDLVNVLVGQVQMVNAISKFTTVVGLQKLAYIKESKLYQALKGKVAVDRDGNSIPDVGTWDGFCRAIGLSTGKVDEDLTNLRVFGEDALQRLTEAGAGYRELRKLRSLPADIREDTIAGIKVDLSDPEDVKAAIEDAVAARREAEKLAEAKDQVIEAKEAKINELDDQLHDRGYFKAYEDFVGEKTAVGHVIGTTVLKAVEKLRKLAGEIETQDLAKFDQPERIRVQAAEAYYVNLLRVKAAIDALVGECFEAYGMQFRDPKLPNEQHPISPEMLEWLEEVREHQRATLAGRKQP